MLGGFFMSINIENMEKPKCAKIFWQMQKQFWLTTMVSITIHKRSRLISVKVVGTNLIVSNKQTSQP